MATGNKTQNQRIIIAISLCLLHLGTLLWAPIDWVLVTVLVYYSMLAYGFISLVRIIMTSGKEQPGFACHSLSY